MLVGCLFNIDRFVIEELIGIVVFFEVCEFCCRIKGSEVGIVEFFREILCDRFVKWWIRVNGDSEYLSGIRGVGNWDGYEVRVFVLKIKEIDVIDVGGVFLWFEVGGGVDVNNVVYGESDGYYLMVFVLNNFGILELS